MENNIQNIENSNNLTDVYNQKDVAISILMLEELLMNNFKAELYHLEYDDYNKTNFIQFRSTLKKEFIEKFTKLVDSYTICSTYKNSTDYRMNYNLIIFFNL